MIIAIDGHSSCGKSTIAKSIAKHLGYVYVDTGAMYRAITLYCLQNNLISEHKIDEHSLQKHISNISIDFKINPHTQLQETWLQGTSVEQTIRGLEVSQHVSAVSKLPFVREKLVAMQRAYGAQGNIVMDGRDIGTVVFPHAHIKFFITASAHIRAQRRYDELTAKGESVNFEEILTNIESRDYEDSHRAISPLKQAADAIVLDNSNMTREEQLTWILKKIPQK
jgi:CMP/dCMP kinase